MLDIIVVNGVSLVIIDRYLIHNGENRTLHLNKKIKERNIKQGRKERKGMRDQGENDQKTTTNNENESREKKTYDGYSFRSLNGNLLRGTDTSS